MISFSYFFNQYLYNHVLWDYVYIIQKSSLGQKKKIIWLSSTARSSFSGRSYFFLFFFYFYFFSFNFFFFFFFFFFFGGGGGGGGGAILNAKHTILCICKDQNASRCQFGLFSTQLGIY